MQPPVLEKLTGKIAVYPAVEKVILFGSRTRVSHGPYADIDLAITGVSDEQEWRQIRQLADVENSGTLLKIDLLRLEEADEELRASIEKEGKVLYERR